MKKTLILPLLLLCLTACTNKSPDFQNNTHQTSLQIIDSTEMTNNFYDNTETYPLIVKELTIEGEVVNPGKVDFSKLTKHSVIVKETLLDGSDSDRFVGAYRYDGYSLFDILNYSQPLKKNADEFNPIIDLYVEVDNDRGEKVVFSWGEIYYPNSLHRILIASDVSRIVPSKSGDLWELPGESRIVAGNDLITERNITSPVRITVRSFPKSFNVTRGLSPIYSDKFKLFENNTVRAEIAAKPVDLDEVTYNAIFYGRGRGIHSTMPFSGVVLKDFLLSYFPVTRDNLKSGIMCVASVDGYRCAVSYSELFNRNDQQEFLLVQTDKEEDGGFFRLFPAGDFFSDRAVKSISEIHLGY